MVLIEGSAAAEHSEADPKQLAHYGHNDDHLGLVPGEQAVTELADDGIMLFGHYRYEVKACT